MWHFLKRPVTSKGGASSRSPTNEGPRRYPDFNREACRRTGKFTVSLAELFPACAQIILILFLNLFYFKLYFQEHFDYPDSEIGMLSASGSSGQAVRADGERKTGNKIPKSPSGDLGTSYTVIQIPPGKPRQVGLQVDNSYCPVPSKKRSPRSAINEGPRRYDEPKGGPVLSAAAAQITLILFLNLFYFRLYFQEHFDYPDSEIGMLPSTGSSGQAV
ncbi:hypothetical protein CHISP_3665 [Chitinispirillum alkaliphilum]|nr:hypothetical protein CHISP_3665 [Chitinispirillum alkaliphilum]